MLEFILYIVLTVMMLGFLVIVFGAAFLFAVVAVVAAAEEAVHIIFNRRD